MFFFGGVGTVYIKACQSIKPVAPFGVKVHRNAKMMKQNISILCCVVCNWQ